jgi:hypothetical protein
MEYKIVPINNTLVENDEKILQIEELIEAKRRMLLEKQKKLKNISKQNQFLEAVKSDYTKYYDYISQQKQDQIKALELLNGYVRDLSTSGQLSKHNIDDSKFEQEKLLKEIDEIKKGLESIINNAL